MEDNKFTAQYINVNTKFRPWVKGVQPPNTDFIVTLPQPLRNVHSMKLKSFNAPSAEYTFSVKETNNSFDVIVNGTTTTIRVIPGKYMNPPSGSNNSILLDQINLQLAPFDISLVFIHEISKYAFTGNNISNVEINFDVRDNYIINTFGWILGFHKSYCSKDAKYATVYPNNHCKKEVPLITGLTTLGTQLYYIADATVVLPNTALYYSLYVDDFLNNSSNSFTEACFPSNNIGGKNLLAQITTKYAIDNNTFYETDTSESFIRVYSTPVTLTKLHIILYDDNSNVVEFNNTDYTFLLEIITTKSN